MTMGRCLLFMSSPSGPFIFLIVVYYNYRRALCQRPRSTPAPQPHPQWPPPPTGAPCTLAKAKPEMVCCRLGLQPPTVPDAHCPECSRDRPLPSRSGHSVREPLQARSPCCPLTQTLDGTEASQALPGPSPDPLPALPPVLSIGSALHPSRLGAGPAPRIGLTPNRHCPHWQGC